MSKQLRSFYRPHKRVVFDGSHPDTGEVPPSMTKQSFAAECDINNIVKHFQPGHMAAMTLQNQVNGTYADLPDNIDFQDAWNTIVAAEAAFMTLPAKVRDRFGQDPGQFLAFLEDPANADEARALGLLNPLAAPPEETTGGDGGSPPSEAPKAP